MSKILLNLSCKEGEGVTDTLHDLVKSISSNDMLPAISLYFILFRTDSTTSY